MKKNISILSIISLAILLSGCGNKYKEVSKNEFSLQAPKNMQIITGDLFDGAEIEYENAESDYYLVVLKDSKEDYEGYQLSEYQEENVNFVLREGRKELKTKNEKINNLDAIITDAVTIDEDGETIWKVALIETDTYFYTIWTWSGPVFITENMKIMENIIHSFKLI